MPPKVKLSDGGEKPPPKAPAKKTSKKKKDSSSEDSSSDASSSAAAHSSSDSDSGSEAVSSDSDRPKRGGAGRGRGRGRAAAAGSEGGAAAKKPAGKRVSKKNAANNDSDDDNANNSQGAGSGANARRNGSYRTDGGVNGVSFEMLPFPHPMTYFGPLIRQPHPSDPKAGARIMPLLKPYRGVGIGAATAVASSASASAAPANSTAAVAAAVPAPPPPPLLPFVDILDTNAVVAPVAGAMAALYLSTIQQQNATDSAIKQSGVMKSRLKPEGIIRHSLATETIINTMRLIAADVLDNAKGLIADDDDDEETRARKKAEMEEAEAAKKKAAAEAAAEGDDATVAVVNTIDEEKSKPLAKLRELLSAQIDTLSASKAQRSSVQAQELLSAMLQRLKRCVFLSYSTAGPPSTTMAYDPQVLSPYAKDFANASAGGVSGPIQLVGSAAAKPTVPPQYSPSAAHGLHCLFFDEYCDASDHLLHRHDGAVCGPAADATGYSEPPSVTEAKEILKTIGTTAPLGAKREREEEGGEDTRDLKTIFAAGGNATGKSGKSAGGGGKADAKEKRKEREAREKEKARAAMLASSNCPPSFNQHLAHYGIFPSKCQPTAIGHVATILSGAISAPTPNRTHTSPLGTLNAIIPCDIKAAALTEEGRVVVVGLVPTGAAAPTTYSGAHQPLTGLKLQRVAGLSLPSGLLPTSIAVAPLCPQSFTLDSHTNAPSSPAAAGTNGSSKTDVPKGAAAYALANNNEVRPGVEITTKLRLATDHMSADAVKYSDYYLRTSVDNYVQFSRDVLIPFGSGMKWGSGNVGQRATKAVINAALAAREAEEKNKSANAPANPITFLPDVRLTIGTQHLRVFLCVCRVAYSTTVTVQSDADSAKEVAEAAEQLRLREQGASSSAATASVANSGAPKMFFKKKAAFEALLGSAKPLATRINKAATQCLSADKSEFFILKCFSPCNDGVFVGASALSPIGAMSFSLPSDYRHRFYAAIDEATAIDYHGAGAHAPPMPALISRTFGQYYLSSAACPKKSGPGYNASQISREAVDSLLANYYTASNDGCSAYGNFPTPSSSAAAAADAASSALLQYNAPTFIDGPTALVEAYTAAALKLNTLADSDTVDPKKKVFNPLASDAPAPPKAGSRHLSATDTVNFITCNAPSQSVYVLSHGPAPLDWCCDVGLGSNVHFGNSNGLMYQSPSNSFSYPSALSCSGLDPNTFNTAYSGGTSGVCERSIDGTNIATTVFPFADGASLVGGPLAGYLSGTAVTPLNFANDTLAAAIPTHEAMGGLSGVSVLTPNGIVARVMSQLRVKNVVAGAFSSSQREGESRSVQLCEQLKAMAAEGGGGAAAGGAANGVGAGGLAADATNPFANLTTGAKKKGSAAASTPAAASAGSVAGGGCPAPTLPFAQILSFVKDWPQIVIPLDTYSFFKSRFPLLGSGGGNADATTSSAAAAAGVVGADPAASPSISSNDALALRWLPRVHIGVSTPDTPENIAARQGPSSTEGATSTVLLKALEGVLANEPVLLPELLAVLRRNQMVVVAFK